MSDTVFGVSEVRWLQLTGLVNVRDLGGSPVDGGTIRTGQLWRSDNLQDVQLDAIRQLKDWGLTDVIDLRSAPELRLEGPAPIHSDPDITVHHFSLLADPNATGIREDVLPWQDFAVQDDHDDDPMVSHYLSYLTEVPGSVVGALRAIARAQGAALVHCAAGKDRTGVVIALALTLAGVPQQQVVADYVRSTERIEAIIDRMMTRPHYARPLRGRSMQSHYCRPEVMEAVLDHCNDYEGGLRGLLGTMGWTDADDAALCRKLVG